MHVLHLRCPRLQYSRESAAFSTLRVYALCGRDWRIAALVCLLMTGPIIANAVSSVHSAFPSGYTHANKYALMQYNIPTQTPVNLPEPYNCEVNNAITVALHTKYVPTSSLAPRVRYMLTETADVRSEVQDLVDRGRRARTCRDMVEDVPAQEGGGRCAYENVYLRTAPSRWCVSSTLCASLRMRA